MSKKQRKQIQQQEFIKQKQSQKASTVEEVLSPVAEAQEEDVTPKAPEVEDKKRSEFKDSAAISLSVRRPKLKRKN